MRAFAIDAVEAGYRVDGPEAAWFERVLEHVAPLIARGLGAVGLSFHFESGRLVLDHLSGRDTPQSLIEFTRAMYSREVPSVARAIQGSAGHIYTFSDFLNRLPPEQCEPYRDAFRAIGIHDALIISHPDGDGGFVTFGAMAEAPIRTVPKQRRVWQQMCAHLASARRLRKRMGTIDAAIDAVLSREGRVVSARGDAAAPAQVRQLEHSARAMARARGSLRRRDPEAALDLWRGLVSGRWSLIDRGLGENRTLVACRNEPHNPDPRRLSSREHAIVELAVTGAPNKQIAYALGLAPTTIATHLQRALRKLGVANRVELVRLGVLAQGRAEHVSVDGQEFVIAAGEREAPMLPLSRAEREVALLIAEGLTNAEIAQRRRRSERTVANQIARIFEKLGIGSRSELVCVMSNIVSSR
ncbi:MAG TPA: LuxR C-terminal-related transcriptional regulator [Polyangiaceae bacterium]|nr:LuxR C-terminal-related transcriptional regulator [Polyangiaceae bacterium]